MSGMTPTGFVVPTIEEIREALSQDLRDAIDPALDTGATSVFGQLIGIMSEREQSLWLALRDVWQAFGPNASGQSLTQLALITGTVRDAATFSTVSANVSLNAGVTLPAGSLARTSDPDAVFETLIDVTNSGGSPAVLSVDMRATTAGPVRANAGTLTTRVTVVAGWTAITNPDDAILGSPDEGDTVLRLRREEELRALGSSNLDSIVRSVLSVEGVLDVSGTENVTLSVDPITGAPGKSFTIVVWEGTNSVPVDLIAQAIWDKKPAGIFSNGFSTGAAIDSFGESHAIDFYFASEEVVSANVEVRVDPETYIGDEALKTSLADRADLVWRVGAVDYYRSPLYMGLFVYIDPETGETRPTGVLTVDALELSIDSDPFAEVDIGAAFNQIATLSTADITIASSPA